MYRSLPLAAVLACCTAANAQLVTHQVLVLNEGYYNTQTSTQEVPVTLGSYDPAGGAYHTVATIPDARFGNYVAVHDNAIYVAADSFLLKYDADSYELLASTIVHGIRRFAIWNDRLVITKGEIGGLPSYCEVRGTADLGLLYSIGLNELPYSCEGVQVVGDVAYIAVNNAFDWNNVVGMIGMLDLNTGTWSGSVDLGPDGHDPENVMVMDDAVYALNNKDFSGSSISKISVAGAGLVYTNNVTTSSGCGSSALADGHIYYVEYAEFELSRYDLATDAVQDTLAQAPATYGLIDDPIAHVLYGTTTDFVSTGTLHVMTYGGTVLSSVPVSVSPGHLALDVRESTGIAEQRPAGAALFPNPATNDLTVTLADAAPIRSLTIADAQGRVVRMLPTTAQAVAHLDVAGLAPGVYTLRINGDRTARFVKH